MNAKDQRKLCKAGYTILRRHDYPQPHITFPVPTRNTGMYM
jgi:hypothetical protein